MHVSAAALDDVAAIQRCLGASGMLVHHRRCYEDGALVTLADVEDLLVRPGLCCSFCNRRADDVERLVAGAAAYICDECVTKCVAVLERQGGIAPPAPAR